MADINTWVKKKHFKDLLMKSLLEDFSKLLKDFAKEPQPTFATFSKLAYEHGTTLVYHWCVPTTPLKSCKTFAYQNSIKYIILSAAKLCFTDPFRTADPEINLKIQLGALFLMYLLYEAQPSNPLTRTKIQLSQIEMKVVRAFEDACIEIGGHLGQSVVFLLEKLRAEEAFSYTLLEMDLDLPVPI